MASAVLHIKDSYYFDVPKSLWRVSIGDKHKLADSRRYDVWVRLDDQFQLWEAERLYDRFCEQYNDAPPYAELESQYLDWKHHHSHVGGPFADFLQVKFADWFAARQGDVKFQTAWADAKEYAGGSVSLKEFKQNSDPRWQWSAEKIAGYEKHLSGKLLIPQPFGTLRNLYQKESGVCISRFMVIEVVVALILWVMFAWLGRQVHSGERPRGRLWNLLEVFVVYIRDQVARPAIGDHEADRFVPLLLTLFFFILGCNLFGLLPWMGAPTGSWAVTFGLACVTFGTVVVCGMLQFGVIGFFLNQVPHMDLPLPMAVLLKPMILAIEILGLLIKHLVLSIRLLANMVAGHIVLLAIMMMAFSLEGAASDLWGVTAVISVFGGMAISVLELGVAFLQAYIFTFLSALFIGAAIHHH